MSDEYNIHCIISDDYNNYDAKHERPNKIYLIENCIQRR